MGGSERELRDAVRHRRVQEPTVWAHGQTSAIETGSGVLSDTERVAAGIYLQPRQPVASHVQVAAQGVKKQSVVRLGRVSADVQRRRAIGDRDPVIIEVVGRELHRHHRIDSLSGKASGGVLPAGERPLRGRVAGY